MKFFLKMLLVGLVLNGAARVAMAEYRFYLFEDAVQQEALFSQRSTPAQLAARVASLAEEQQIPIAPEDVTVSFNGPQATVSATYTERVEVVPRAYVRDWPFELRVSVRRLP